MPIGGQCYKLNMFADDTVAYLTNPTSYLSNLISVIDDFGALSGFSINYSKSELYPLDLLTLEKQHIQSHFNFRWVRSSWRHLGVLISLDLKNLYVANYD